VTEPATSGQTTQPTTTPRDRLKLDEVAAVTAEADEAVVVEFGNLAEKAKEAVEQALENGGTLTCSTGQYSDTTGVDVLAEHIMRHREETGERDAIERTYLSYDGTYYGMMLVQDGDMMVVDSLP
jgi:hypothetical protein